MKHRLPGPPHVPGFPRVAPFPTAQPLLLPASALRKGLRQFIFRFSFVHIMRTGNKQLSAGCGHFPRVIHRSSTGFWG